MKKLTGQKLRLQLELKLQAKMLDGFKAQGWFATKTSDRFKAGRPDLRVSHRDFGQCDFELKYSFEAFDGFAKTGLSKLQWLKIKEMNEHGMPAVGLVYSEPLNRFFLSTILRDTLPPDARCVSYHDAHVIDAAELFNKAMGHLNDLGYRTPRN